MNYKTQGFTLLEVIIATVLFAIVLGAVLMTLTSGQDSFNNASCQASLEMESTILMDKLTQYLSECKIVSSPVTATGHSTMTIQIPIAVTGTYWNADGSTIYWGAHDQLGWKMTFEFSPYTSPNNVLDESVSGIDYNSDKDLTDKFEYGIIKLIFKDASDVIQDTVVLGEHVALIYGLREGDIDGDGELNPIFIRVNSSGTEDIVTGNRIKINLCMAKLAINGKCIGIIQKNEVTLINPQ